jgi:hypothetical protein
MRTWEAFTFTFWVTPAAGATARSHLGKIAVSDRRTLGPERGAFGVGEVGALSLRFRTSVACTTPTDVGQRSYRVVRSIEFASPATRR